MIGLDTNILVRYLVMDDRTQSKQAADLIESQCSMEIPGFISSVVLVEIVWVLERSYKFPRKEIANAIEGMLQADELEIEHSESAWQALRLFQSSKADFSDAYLGRIHAESKCKTTYTFDRGAARLNDFTLLV